MRYWNWVKENGVGLSAGIIALLALGRGCMNQDAINDVSAYAGNVGAGVDGLKKEIATEIKDRGLEDKKLLDISNGLQSNVNNIASRVAAIEDTLENCPCNKRSTTVRRARPKTVARPVSRDTVAVRRDTAVVKENNVVQNASGCGNDQNAHVVINGDNNIVTIKNNADDCPVDTAKKVVRRVVTTVKAEVVIKTDVRRRNYCR